MNNEGAMTVATDDQPHPPITLSAPAHAMADTPEAARAHPTVFEVKDLSVCYGGFRAVRDVEMNVAKHEITAFIGPSGCGKTTCLLYTSPSPRDGLLSRMPSSA